MTKYPHKLHLGDTFGYIIDVYDRNWCLRYIMEKNEVRDQIKTTFLELAGPSASFFFI